MTTLFNLDYEEIKQNDNDHIATPRWIVEKIYNLINIQSYKSIWLPFDNYDSEFKLVADELNVTYKSTHKYDENSNDFFITNPPEDCDLLISNPPFSIQNDILKRCFDLVVSGGGLKHLSFFFHYRLWKHHLGLIYMKNTQIN